MDKLLIFQKVDSRKKTFNFPNGKTNFICWKSCTQSSAKSGQDPSRWIINSGLTYSARKSFCWKNNLCVPVIFAVENVLHGNSQYLCSRRHLQIGCKTYHRTQQKCAGMQAVGMPGILLSCDCLGTF